jgi:hypothetical protein
MHKRIVTKPKQIRAKATLELFNESAAGIAVSGDSGTGKSTAMLALFESLIRHNEISSDPTGITLIDPHGDLAAQCEEVCSSLPRRLRERCFIIRPCNLSHIAALNPLHVPDAGRGALHHRACLTSKVSQVTRNFLYAFGEHNFDSKPVLRKWLSRTLMTTAMARLTIPDGKFFFDVGSDVYHAMAQAAPDAIARMEMNDLIEMRPREREELIASTKNRFLGFLENPVVTLALGRPNGWIDVGTLLRNRTINIISLEPGGVLRDEDVEIFANLWLCEFLYAAYNADRDERAPHVIFLDELPVFSSSFNLLTRALAQVRKFKVRLVAAFQGTGLFPQRTEDPLLNALISQCRTTLVFRHKNPVDAKFFGELVTLPMLDPHAEKHRLTQWQQYQDGNDTAFLTDEGESWSDADQSGGSQSDARGATQTDTTSENRSTSNSDTDTVTRGEDTLSEATSRARGDQTGTGSSRATGTSNTRTDGTNWSSTATRGGSRSRRMTLVPRMRWREVVTSVQFLSTDEQIVLGARDITRFAIGEALAYVAGNFPKHVRFPLVQSPFYRTPKFAAKKLMLLRDEVAARPEFAQPAQIVSERDRFEQQLVAHLERIARQQTLETSPVVPPSDNNPLLSI